MAARGEPADDGPNPELLAVGNKVVEYIATSKCYLRADCGRETIK